MAFYTLDFLGLAVWGRVKVDVSGQWQTVRPCCVTLCRIEYCSLFLDSYTPDSDNDTDSAMMFVQTLQHIPNRRVFHMPCDNAMRLQTPALYTKRQNQGQSPAALADYLIHRAETAFPLVDFYKPCYFTPMVVQ